MSHKPSTPERRKRAEIYREAARMMEARVPFSDFPCWCLATLQGVDLFDWRDAPAVRPFLAAFSDSPHISVMSAQFINRLNGDDERLLALCFMAAMVEAGDA